MLKAKYEKQANQNLGPGARRVLKFMFESWTTDNLCDLYLLVENKYIPAHKVVLASYSQVMADLLCKYPKSKCVHIDMSDYDRVTVMSVLSFLYTTDVDITDTNVAKILACSTELGVQVLIDMCREHLSKFNSTNVREFYKIAKKFGLVDLQLQMKPHVFTTLQDVVNDPQFEEYTYDDLVILLTSEEYARTELQLFQAIVRWIDFDRKQRVMYAPQLLQYVQFRTMSIGELTSQVEIHTHLFDPSNTYKMLYDAMK